MFKQKKSPPTKSARIRPKLKEWTVRYLLQTESDEYPKELTVLGKTREHARNVFKANMRFDVDYQIISIT